MDADSLDKSIVCAELGWGRRRTRFHSHTNSPHAYSIEEALQGIAEAGYRFVGLSAVRGWTEHVPLEADAKTLQSRRSTKSTSQRFVVIYRDYEKSFLSGRHRGQSS